MSKLKVFKADKTIKISTFAKIITLLLMLCLLVPFFTACKLTPTDIAKGLTTITIDATYDDELKTLAAVEKIEYINNSDAILTSLNLHLYANAYRSGAKYKPVSPLAEEKAYPDGKSFGNISIKDVSLNGAASAHSIGGEDENILIVPFLEELFPEQKIMLEISFEVKLANVRHRLGYADDVVNLSGFYPVPCVVENGKFRTDPYCSTGDPFYSDMANFNVSITANSAFKVAASGNFICEDMVNNKTKTTFKAMAVRDYALCLSQKYEVKTEELEGTLIKYYYYNDEFSAQNLQTAVDALQTFNRLFGNYPYKTLTVAKTPFLHGGMEYGSLVYIADDIKDNMDYQNVIIHEIAHQWWFGLVGSDQINAAWLDEGLAEFSTSLFYKENPSYGINFETLTAAVLESYTTFYEVYTGVLKEVDTSMNRSVLDFRTEPEYTMMAYTKAQLMFASLYEIIGESKFIKGLRHYFEENIYKIATPAHFIASIQRASHDDLENFFNSWIEGHVNILAI